MADFTNRITEQDVPNYTGRSQGYSDTSVGDLFKNLGSTIQSASAAFDKAGEKISSDAVTEAIDKYNIEAGVYGTGDGDIPKDLKSQFDRAKKMYEASRRAGGSLSSHYYSRLVSTIRDVRQKYPGYGDAIDKQVTSILGFNPREAAVRSFLSDSANREKQVAEEQKVKETFYNSPEVAALVGVVDPAAVSEEQFAKHKRYVLEYNAKQARFDQLQKEGRINAQTADEVATHYMSGAMTRIYNEGALGDFLRTGEAPTDPAQLEELVARSRTLVPQLRKVLTEQMTPMIGPGFTSEDMTKIIDAKMKDIQPIIDAVGSKDWTAAAHATKMLSWQEEQAKADVIKRFGPTAFMKKNMEELFGKEYSGVLLDQMATQQGHKDFAAMLTVTLAGDQGQTFDQALGNIVNNSASTRDEKNKTVRSLAETTMKGMIRMDDDNRFLQMGEKLYTPETLNRIFSMIEDGDLDFLQFVTPKAITDRYAKVGGSAGQQYLQSITTAMLQSEEIRNLRNQWGRGDMPEGRFFLMDNGTLQFKSTEEINKGFSGGTIASSGSVEINAALQEINGNLANIKYAHDKLGGDYNKLIADLGIKDVMPIKALEQPQNKPSPNEKAIEAPTGGDTDMTAARQKLAEEIAGGPVQSQEQALSNITLTKGVLDSMGETLANSVAEVEGTSGENGYDTILGYQQDRFGVKPSQMTLGELKDFTAPGSEYAKYSEETVGRMATPLGKYQIVGSTLRNLQKQLGLPDDTIFDETTQDRMFLQLLKGRGWDDFLAGGIDSKEMASNLSKEWEGFSRFKDQGKLAKELETLKATFLGQRISSRIEEFLSAFG